MHKRIFLPLLITGILSFGACSSPKSIAQPSEPATENLQESPAPPQSELASTAISIEEKDIKQAKIQWLTLDEAYALNQKEARKIFVDVYTDWCGWCKKMDKETFANAEVAEYVNNHFYAVKLDAESTREFELAGEKMTDRVVARQLGATSFPTIILIHEDFQKFQPVPGYRPAKEFKEILTKFNAIDINPKQ